MRGIFNTSTIWSIVGGFVGRLIIFFSISCMCLIWLNMHLFSWILVLMISLSLRVVMTCTLLHFPVSFWSDMNSKTFFTDVGYFLPIMRIQTFFLFIFGNAWFHRLLFSDWYMHDMLLCSQCCVVIPMVVPLGGKSILTSNILSLIEGWYERSNFNVGRAGIFVPGISSEPGGQPLPNLLLCSSIFSDEQYLSLFVCGSRHFIVALMFV